MYPIPAVPSLLPSGLLEFLLDEFNMEIEKGDSFPYYEVLTMDEFKDVWFHRDGHICIMVLGEIPELDYSVSDNDDDGDGDEDKNNKNSGDGNSNTPSKWPSSSSSRRRHVGKKSSRRSSSSRSNGYQQDNDGHNDSDKGKLNETADSLAVDSEGNDTPGELLSNGVRSIRNTKIYKRRKALRNLNLNIHWEKQCLGIFELQPLFPGRSSHVVTGLFLVNAGIRGKGIGRTLVETFIDWSKRLGFTSCCFPLLYETNVGMRQILEGLNFRKVGKLLEAGILKGFDMPVDSFIYSKEFTHIKRSIDLLMDPEKTQEIAKYERLKHYLETGQYPTNCDRNEKARLRVTSKTHSLVNGKLMSRGKEVVYDPNRQRQIVLEIHLVDHQGINKVTSKVSERYHWKGIKNTVTSVIANCNRCKVRYNDEEGIIVKQGEGATKVQASSTLIDVSSFPSQNVGKLRDLHSQGAIGDGHSELKNNKRRRIDIDTVNSINDIFKRFPDKQGDGVTMTTSAVGPISDADIGALGNNHVTVAPQDNSTTATTTATTTAAAAAAVNSTTTTDSNILNAAMLSLEDNVMAALEIVQKEQQQQQQQQHQQQQSDIQTLPDILSDGLHEYDQFLLNFNFDEEYHEEEDEDYQVDDDDDDEEEEEEEEEEDDGEEEEDDDDDDDDDDEGEVEEDQGVETERKVITNPYPNDNTNQFKTEPQGMNSVTAPQLQYQGTPDTVHRFPLERATKTTDQRTDTTIRTPDNMEYVTQLPGATALSANGYHNPQNSLDYYHRKGK